MIFNYHGNPPKQKYHSKEGTPIKNLHVKIRVVETSVV